MIHRTSKLDSRSICSSSCFKSMEDINKIAKPEPTMSNSTFPKLYASMLTSIRDEIMSSTADKDLSTMITLLREKRTQKNPTAPAVVATTIASVRRDATLPKRNGKPEKLEFYP